MGMARVVGVDLFDIVLSVSRGSGGYERVVASGIRGPQHELWLNTDSIGARQTAQPSEMSDSGCAATNAINDMVSPRGRPSVLPSGGHLFLGLLAVGC
jgi:hypothetical protein